MGSLLVGLLEGLPEGLDADGLGVVVGESEPAVSLAEGRSDDPDVSSPAQPASSRAHASSPAAPVRPVTAQMTPSASIASATWLKPAMLAPAT